MSLKLAAGLLTVTLGAGFAIPAATQEVLPFPPKPSGSIAGRTMQESVYSPLPPVSHLPKDAPNILIVLIDDVGPAQTDTYGGEIHTPTLSKIAQEGISYNRFHTTAMCSPTRAALLTGRNHHRVGNGQIGELANDWDGYSGAIPKSSATVALYVKDGVLSYEYNLFEIMRTHIKAKDKLPTGKAKIEVETTYVERKPAGPLKVVLKVNGNEVASGMVPVSAPLIFTANDCLDFGIDLGSPVGIEYYDQAPFKFNGTIEGAHVQYLSGAPAQLQQEKLQTHGAIPSQD